MMKTPSKYFYVVFVAVLVLLASYLILKYSFFAPALVGRTPISVTADQGSELSILNEEKSKWLEVIKNKGAAAAYQQFKNEYAKYDYSTQHNTIHMLGELLYEVEGVKGITICDDSFAFGCYHGFFPRALSENGLGAMRELDQACVDKYGDKINACSHGLGHGILEYLGHNSLNKALEICTNSIRLQDVRTCLSGVFMEYNFPTIIDDGKAEKTVRHFDPENPYFPCDTTIPEEFRKLCYYTLGEFWLSASGLDYAKIGKFCSDLSDTGHKAECFKGVGNNIAPTSNYDVESVREKCEKIQDEDGEFYCKAEASRSFLGLPQHRLNGLKVCEGIVQSLEEKHNYSCLKQSDIDFLER